MSRKTILLIILALALIGGAVLWYVLSPEGEPQGRTFFGNLPIIGGRAPLPTPPPAIGAPPPGGIGAPSSALREIIARDILAPTMSQDGSFLLFVDRANGHLVRSDLDGRAETTLVNLTLLEAFDGLWSPLKNRVVISYPDTGAIKRFVESTATGTPSYFLPASTLSASWSPDGRQIAYLVRQGDRTNLVIADQQNRNARTVYQTPVPDFTLSWTAPNTVLLVSRPSGLAPSLILKFDTASRRAEPILAGSSGVVVMPLPDASGFVFSRSSERGEAQSLGRYAFSSGGASNLDVVTLAEKCAASTDSKLLYCGVPRNIPGPSPDTWYRGAVALADEIVEINLGSGTQRTIAGAEANLDIVSPFVSPDGRYLFFQDKATGYLWRLTLRE